MMKTMPYANNQGVQVHYEVEGNGPSLVLQHGLSETHETWSIGSYVESLMKDYTLILMDARGHGASDKPHDPKAYIMKLMVTDVITVLDDLNVSKAHFLGYSMGGWIGFGIAKYAPQRFHSLIISSMHPYAKPNEPEQSLQWLRLDMSAKLALAEKWLGSGMTPEWKAWVHAPFAANDWEALIALVSRDWACSFDSVLPTMTMPVLLLVGESDSYYAGARECVKSIPNATFVSFPGLGHTGTFLRKDLVLPHIIKFLKKVGQP
jgi:pimeloyl-ACP methyl ester carboxylesterase